MPTSKQAVKATSSGRQNHLYILSEKHPSELSGVYHFVNLVTTDASHSFGTNSASKATVETRKETAYCLTPTEMCNEITRKRQIATTNATQMEQHSCGVKG